MRGWRVRGCELPGNARLVTLETKYVTIRYVISVLVYVRACVCCMYVLPRASVRVCVCASVRACVCACACINIYIAVENNCTSAGRKSKRRFYIHLCSKINCIPFTNILRSVTSNVHIKTITYASHYSSNATFKQLRDCYITSLSDR